LAGDNPVNQVHVEQSETHRQDWLDSRFQDIAPQKLSGL
jgi:hypothetical protein